MAEPEPGPGAPGPGRDAGDAADGPGRGGAAAGGPAPGGELAAARAEAESWKQQALRARADYDNLQRRVARDAQVERERNKARVLEGFLPILELAHMAAHQAEVHPGPLSEGVVMLAREFDRLAEREGLVRVGRVGEAVDTTRHDVLAEEDAGRDDAGEPLAAPGCVSRVVQPGYVLGDKVLRFAKVTVQPGRGSSGRGAVESGPGT